MYTATPQQLEAYGTQAEEAQANSNEGVKSRFVDDFLEFADRITGSDMGSGGGGGAIARGVRQWEMQGNSKFTRISDADDSPPMGVSVVGFRHEVRRERIGSREKVIASKVTAARVEVGPISPDSFPSLVNAEPVLQVYSHPPTVLYAAEPGKLEVVEPESRWWENAMALAKSLTSKEAQLVSKHKNS